MDIHTILVFGHIAGTILGVGGATLAEVNVVQALRDGTVSADEKRLMHTNYTVIRIGTALIVLSGILLVWWHLSQGNNWVLTSEKLWMKELVTVIIVINAVALSRKWVPLLLGSTISFTSWWVATLLGVWRGVPFSFLMLVAGYVVLIAIIAVILHFIRKRYTKI